MFSSLMYICPIRNAKGFFNIETEPLWADGGSELLVFLYHFNWLVNRAMILY